MTLPDYTLVHQAGAAPRRRSPPEGLESFHPSSDRHLRSLAPSTSAQVMEIGLWDLATAVGGLPSIIERWNLAQAALRFYLVQAAAPAGSLARPERLMAWFRRRAAPRAQAPDPALLQPHLIFEDFWPRAQRVRTDLALDYLICLVPAFIAWETRSEIGWNYLAVAERHIIAASTLDLADAARRARRSFETAVAWVALAALLAELNPRVQFHPETRGCLFDLDEDRSSLPRTLAALALEPSCEARLDPRWVGPARALINVLAQPRRARRPRAARPPRRSS